jgi:hypothetical protein
MKTASASSSSSSSSSLSLFRHVGDAAHVATIVSTVAFALAVGLYANTASTFLFDAAWKRDGFCVTHQDVPYWTSHDMCLYVDVALAVVLAVVYMFCKETPGMATANMYVVPNIVGQVAHGIGHGAIAMSLRNRGGDMEELFAVAERSVWERLQQESITTFLSEEIPQVIFWLGLIYASTPHSKKSTIALFFLLARVGQIYTPARFGFTYVQTVLFMIHAFHQTNRPVHEKDFSYATFPLLASFPVTVAGWVESTQCSAFVRDTFYGHVIYDGCISVSVIVWYLVCYVKARIDSPKVKSL